MMNIAGLQEKLGSIPDLRRPWGNLRYKLEDILVIGLTTLFCNGEETDEWTEETLYRRYES
jgi:hypothetical protein